MPKAPNRYYWTEIKVSAGPHFPLEAVRIHSLPLSGCDGCWHAFICGSITPLSGPVSSILSLFCLLLFSLSQISLHLSYKDPYDGMLGLIWIIQQNLSISRSLTQSHLQKSLFICFYFILLLFAVQDNSHRFQKLGNY